MQLKQLRVMALVAHVCECLSLYNRRLSRIFDSDTGYIMFRVCYSGSDRATGMLYWI